MTLRAGIRGSGHYLPERVVENSEFEQSLDTTDEWIKTRTGIERRHFAAKGETTSDLGAKAAIAALEDAGITADEVDALIVATSTADLTFPSAATMIQARIGMTQGFAYDVQAVCAGFVYALSNAHALIASGQAQRVLVIGSETFSRLMDWTDRTTCVLFGDGAGAVVMQACDRNRLLGFEMHSDGALNGCLNLAYTAETSPLVDDITTQKGTFTPITMNGREVYRFAVSRVPEVLEKTLFHAGLAASDIDWLILHQANQRILDAVAKRLKLPPERVVSNLAKHGNTSAASIPIALDEWVRSGKIQPGHKIAMSGFGAGLTWGAALLEWGL